MRITSVEVQGAADRDAWVKQFKLAYRSHFRKPWVYYQHGGVDHVFTGNSDRDTVVYHGLHTPVECRHLRIVVVSFHIRPGLRLEVHRVPLDYSVVELALATDFDLSDRFRPQNFTAILAASANAAGPAVLDPTDMATFLPHSGAHAMPAYWGPSFLPQIVTAVSYNTTVLMHTTLNESSNMSSVQAALLAALNNSALTAERFSTRIGTNGTDATDATNASNATNATNVTNAYEANPFGGTVEHVEILSAAAAQREVEIVPEPEPEPFIVPYDAYTCACLYGWAHGMCEYDFISEYDANCTMATGGHCDLDVDECALPHQIDGTQVDWTVSIIS